MALKPRREAYCRRDANEGARIKARRPLGSCRGVYGVLGQWGIHLVHPLIDLEGECVPPPTERQGYDTIILS